MVEQVVDLLVEMEIRVAAVGLDIMVVAVDLGYYDLTASGSGGGGGSGFISANWTSTVSQQGGLGSNTQC